MAQVKKVIVCLANSRKLSGRCIAGVEIEGGKRKGWLRPVSSREHEEVSEYERQYENGSDPKLLDLVEVPLSHHKPKGYQTENWLLDPEYYWVKRGQVQWSQLQKLTDPVDDLWINGISSFSGLNDRMDTATAEQLDHSLRLIKPERLTLSVFAPGAAFGNSKRRVQARFEYGGNEYRLWVTDPDYERQFLLRENGDYELGECFLTISIGEQWEGFCYKLVAAIIEPPSGAKKDE